MIQAVTFDLLGTLVDWVPSWWAASAEVAGRKSLAVDARTLADAWKAETYPIQAAAFRPYREVLALALEKALRVHGAAFELADVDTLLDRVGDWRPHGETLETLEGVREAGCKIGVISNNDREIFERIPIPFRFDVVTLAGEVGCYKPDPSIFAASHRSLGISAAEVLHVGMSTLVDVPVAGRGIRMAWMNPEGQPLPAICPQPRYILTRLRGVLDIVRDPSLLAQ